MVIYEFVIIYSMIKIFLVDDFSAKIFSPKSANIAFFLLQIVWHPNFFEKKYYFIYSELLTVSCITRSRLMLIYNFQYQFYGYLKFYKFFIQDHFQGSQSWPLSEFLQFPYVCHLNMTIIRSLNCDFNLYKLWLDFFFQIQTHLPGL